MTAPLLALVTALFYSLQTVFARVGLRSTSSLTGVIVASAVASLALWIATPLFGQLTYPSLQAIGYFALGGIMSPGLAWFLFYEGIVRVGMARAAPLTSIAPFLSTVGGIVVFGEQLTATIAIGLAAVVIGVAMITSGHEERTFKRRDLAFPLLSAITFSSSILFRKAALSTSAPPILGAAIGTTVGLLFLVLASRLMPAARSLRIGHGDLKFIVLAGLSVTVAYGLYFNAIQLGKIIVVAPIISVSPLITLLIGTIFLRQYERFTAPVIAGSICTALGAVLLTVS